MFIKISPAELAPALLAVGLIVSGASFLLQAPRWLILLRGILAKPESYFLGAIIEMLAGLVLALSYDRWDSTWPIFTTILGWLMALEGATFLVAPQLFQGFNRLSDTFMLRYTRIGGAVLLVLGILLGRFVMAA